MPDSVPEDQPEPELYFAPAQDLHELPAMREFHFAPAEHLHELPAMREFHFAPARDFLQSPAERERAVALDRAVPRSKVFFVVFRAVPARAPGSSVYAKA